MGKLRSSLMADRVEAEDLDHTRFIRPVSLFGLDSSRRPALLPSIDAVRGLTMQDLIWLAVLAGLLALTLAYVRLCDAA